MPHPRNAGYRRGENWSCCPVCGNEYRASAFRKRWDGLWVCAEDYEERHPQDLLRVTPDDMRPAVVAGCCGMDGNPLIRNSDVPLCPVLFSPLNGQTVDGSTVATLSFGTYPGIGIYHVYVWADGESQPDDPTYTVASSPAIASGLTPNKSYNWYVSAANSDGASRDCSSLARFFTTALPVPACPELVAPEDGGSLEGDSTLLEWATSSGATFYKVYIKENNGPLVLVTTTTGTSYSISDLTLGSTFQWIVRAGNASGESVGCGSRFFHTQSTVALTEPSHVVYDNQEKVTVYVARSGEEGAASVDYATADGTAVAPGNYTDTSGTLNWADGEEGPQPVEISIQPLETQIEYSTDVLYAWESGTADPRNCKNDHEYRYGSSSWSSDFGAVKTEAETDIGRSLEPTVIGYSLGSSTTDQAEMFPYTPASAAGEEEVLYLHFNSEPLPPLEYDVLTWEGSTSLSIPVEAGGAPPYFWTGQYSDHPTHVGPGAGVYQVSDYLTTYAWTPLQGPEVGGAYATPLLACSTIVGNSGGANPTSYDNYVATEETPEYYQCSADITLVNSGQTFHGGIGQTSAGPYPGVPDPAVPDVPLLASFVTSISGYDNDGVAGSMWRYAAPSLSFSPDILIQCRRKIRAPDGPCDPRCENPYPDYPPDSRYCVIEDSPTLKGNWEAVEDTFKALSLYEVTSGSVSMYPLNPILPSTDPNYSDESFWTAAYAAAVSAGELPEGLTYDADGDGGATTYPRVLSSAYRRQYKTPLEFTVGISNASGMQVADPDEATVYILPAT